MNDNQKTLVLIDGKSVFYRGFYAMPNLTTKNGVPTGGVYGFAVLALELFSRIKPDYVAVAWDKKGTNIRKRLEIYDKYKGNRHAAPPEFYAQIPLLRELLDALNWPFYETDDYEADDIIGTFDLQANEAGIRTIMISSDLDLLQLVDDNTELYALKKGLANLEKFDVEHFREKYGVEIPQFADLKALKGDASDNIPGVPGVGEKTAIDLLQKFGDLQGVFDNINSDQIKPAVAKKLHAGKELAEMSRKLVEIYRDAPLTLDFEKADARNLNPSKLREKLSEFEFWSLIRKLPDFMKEDKEEIAPKEQDFSPAKVLDSSKIPSDFFEKNSLFSVVVPGNSLLKGQANLFDEGGNFVWVSAEKSLAYEMDFEDFAKMSADKKIISHDLKLLAEQMLGRNLEPNFVPEFDTKHAAFLLNSLKKSVDLAEAVNFFEMEDGVVREMTAGEKISATWSLYKSENSDLSKNEKLANLAHNVDFPLQILLAKIEKRGVKLDTKILAEMSLRLGKEIRESEQKIWEMAGKEFNVSSAQQLSEILFNVLNLPSKGIKKSARGYFSTGQKELDKLHGQHPMISEIETFRAVMKLKNTYVDALPNLVDEKNYLHTTLRQDITATGRLSSSSPNLQNIPTRTDESKEIRHAFVASDGKVLVNADYSQFELRLAAAMAGDENMIKVFAKDSADIHTETAAEAFGLFPENVTSEQRRHAKVINFGILYGMSPHGLAAATGMDFIEAKKFIDKYFEIRRPIREYLDKTIAKAKNEGFVETLFGRRRPTPDVNSTNFLVRESAKRAAANMPIQGTEADLMKMSMLKVEREIPEASQFMQIHDSIMVECDPENAEEVAFRMKKIMENIYPELGVSLRVDTKIGRTWAEF